MKKNLATRHITLKARRLLVILLIVLLTTNFRVQLNSDGTVTRWYVSKGDPTVWINFCDETIDFGSNDVPSSDSHYGGATDQQSVLDSIIHDFNDVGTSFFRFANYPLTPDSPPAPQPGDSPFTKEAAKIRTIDICFGDIPYYAAAQSLIKTNGDACDLIDSDSYYASYCSKTRIYSCDITMNKDYAKDSMRRFIHILTHELGHCVGFLHNHDTHLSIMSYLADPDEILRLQMDDKMGMTYLYPSEESYNDEEPTLGLSGCQ